MGPYVSELMYDPWPEALGGGRGMDFFGEGKGELGTLKWKFGISRMGGCSGDHKSAFGLRWVLLPPHPQ